MRESDAVILRLQLFGNQQIVFRLQQISAVVNREFEIVAVRDRVLWASLDTITAEDAPAVIDVVNLGVALVHANALGGRSGIVLGDDVDAFRRTRGGAQKAGYTFFSSVFVDVQEMLATVSRLNGNGLFRVFDGPFLLRDVRQRDAHALDDGLR